MDADKHFVDEMTNAVMSIQALNITNAPIVIIVGYYEWMILAKRSTKGYFQTGATTTFMGSEIRKIDKKHWIEIKFREEE